MDEKYALTTAPSARQRLETSALNELLITTLLGASYVFPDVTPELFRELMVQLDERTEHIVLHNISGATLVLPLRIIKEVGLLAAEGCSWASRTLWSVE